MDAGYQIMESLNPYTDRICQNNFDILICEAGTISITYSKLILDTSFNKCFLYNYGFLTKFKAKSLFYIKTWKVSQYNSTELAILPETSHDTIYTQLLGLKSWYKLVIHYPKFTYVQEVLYIFVQWVAI